MKAYGQAKKKATNMIKKKTKKPFNGHNKGQSMLEQKGRADRKLGGY